MKHKTIYLTLVTVLASTMAISAQLNSFPTGGHTVYHLSPATVVGKQRGVVSASFDGTVLCHSKEGKLIWENSSDTNFPFDLAVADINGDGLDETFVGTAGGNVNAYASDGKKLWSFATNGAIQQVCPIKTSSGKWVILAGGIDETVISISANGQLISSIKAGDVVRHIRKGNILGDGKEYAVVATTADGHNGVLSLILVNPDNLAEVWRKKDLVKNSRIKRRWDDMMIMDVNGDKKEDIVLSGDPLDNGRLFAYDFEGKLIFAKSNKDIPIAPYRMNMLSHIPSIGNESDYILGLFANILIVYDGKGDYKSFLINKYDFTNSAYDEQTSTYYLGSCASGGDGIYALDLKNPNWKEAFKNLKAVGKTAEIDQNIAKINEQIKAFKAPSYQPAPKNVTVIGQLSDNKGYDKFKFATNERLMEKITDSTELWCKVTDHRWDYKMTAQEIVNFAKEKEAKGEDFILWVWHGEALYISPATLDKVMDAAPKHLLGFACAEMEQTGPVMQELIPKIMMPLADKCLKTNRKIIFRNKGIYWSGTCYLPFYKNLLFNPKYKQVFVPGLEETNCRTQEMSLASRVGLWETGFFDSWSCRVVTDNACFNRMWEYSSQQIMSHYVRNMVLNASMGSDFYFIDVHSALTKPAMWAQLQPFYELINKGIVSIPNRSDLLSVSSLCLGMKSPPEKEYIRHGINGHKYNFDVDNKTLSMAFDRLDAYWGAAQIADYDFSKYGYGADRRMLNFLPKYPYGLVSIVPDETDLKSHPLLTEKVSTDGRYFYDENGKQREAVEYKQTMLEKLKTAAAKLPILVKGDAAWSVVRLDPKHVRVVLVDPGYTDPADRDVEINLQHLNGLKCTDILSNDSLEIKNQNIKVHIPIGVFRVLDIEHN